MSLAKWGRRHDYFASDLGSGVPISRGSPYRSYTGSGAALVSGVGRISEKGG